MLRGPLGGPGARPCSRWKSGVPTGSRPNVGTDRWVTDARRAPRGIAGGTLVMCPGVRSWSAVSATRRTCSGTLPSGRRGPDMATAELVLEAAIDALTRRTLVVANLSASWKRDSSEPGSSGNSRQRSPETGVGRGERPWSIRSEPRTPAFAASPALRGPRTASSRADCWMRVRREASRRRPGRHRPGRAARPITAL